MDYSKHIRRRLQNLGVSYQHAAECARWFQKQLDSTGTERAITYLKSVGDTILWYLYGTPSKPSWVKTKHRFPSGIYCLRSYPERTLLRVAKFARSVVLGDLTVNQVTKVLKGATDPFSGTSDGLQQVARVISLGCLSAGFHPTPFEPSKPMQIGRQFRKVQSVSGPTELAMEPPLRGSYEMLMGIPTLQALPYFNEAFLPLKVSDLDDLISPKWNGYVGEIHAAQEGGGKLRMYASPYTGIQCLMSPIHDWIDRYRRRLPTDCTYDQLSGARWAQEQLLKGLTVHSVDLSTATCRFPLGPQLDLLASLGIGQVFLDALKFVCQGKWKVGEELVGLFPESISWSVGQPLGTKPSMSMFSLTHNLLIAGLCRSLGLNPRDSFRVLGDDVVMVNDDLHQAYRGLMSLLGVPISEHKSHSSSNYAEFAGCSITKTELLRPGRWRRPDVNSHLGIALDLGTPLYGEVSRQWLDCQKLWLFMSGQFSPPVEEWNRYLKASTSLQQELGEYKDPLRAKSWISGFRETVLRQFPELKHGTNLSMFGRPDPRTLWDVIPPCPQRDRWYHYWSEFSDLGDINDRAYMFGVNAIMELVSDGVIHPSELPGYLHKVEAKLMELYWLPPASSYLRDGKLTKKLLTALAG